VLGLPTDGAGEDDGFDVSADRDHLVGLRRMFAAGDVLLGTTMSFGFSALFNVAKELTGLAH